MFALSTLCWCFIGGGTPVLIPNTAVKPSRADGTRKGRVGRRQHRVLKICLTKLATNFSPFMGLKINKREDAAGMRRLFT